MTDVKFREMRFDLDASVPFQWNGANPLSGVFNNVISFVLIGFERYLVFAIRDAMKTMTSPELREEAEVFIAQEAQHAGAHRRHVNALIAQYPPLASTLEKVVRSFDELYKTKPNKFHLAYIASLEATFPPVFTFMINNRDRLFNGDRRVASMFLWHYIEELEHRSSATMIYDGVVGDQWYRIKTLWDSMKHLDGLGKVIVADFIAAVPPEKLGIAPSALLSMSMTNAFLRRVPLARRFAGPPAPSMFDGIPVGDLFKLVTGLVRSQMPSHRPADFQVPEWFHTWMSSHAAGEDMAHYFGTPSSPQVAAAAI